jgi:hypothetical protein
MMTLNLRVLENIGTTIAVGPGQLRRAINGAVGHMMNVVESTAKMYNMAPLPTSVSVVAGTQSYKLTDSLITIRKILLVERSDCSPPVTCTLIDIRQKNKYAGANPFNELGGRGIRPTVYVTRTALGDWYLNFPYDPQTTMTIDVYYAPQLDEMELGTETPTEVPENHHEIIAVRATIQILGQHGKPTVFWEKQYAERKSSTPNCGRCWKWT